MAFRGGIEVVLTVDQVRTLSRAGIKQSRSGDAEEPEKVLAAIASISLYSSEAPQG